MPFISIQLNSNRPQQIGVFFDSIEATADTPEAIEVLLHIDKGDSAMEQAVEAEKAKRKFSLRVLQTDLVQGYLTLWKPLNPLLEMTHPDVYFVTNFSDEFLFETKGWDTQLRAYVGYYPDHIFRLRGSQYRFRNYRDFWECGYVPDSIAFYTKRWLDLGGDWNPCLGPDTFQQFVSFYLHTSDRWTHVQYNRDIPLPFMRFSGEGAGIGLTGIARFRRMLQNNRAWFTLVSHRIQQEAKRRAMRLKAHIVAHRMGEAIRVEEQPHRKCFAVKESASGRELETFCYRLSWLRITAINISRMPWVLYYAGSGKAVLRYPLHGLVVMAATYLPGGEKLLAAVDRRLKRRRDGA